MASHPPTSTGEILTIVKMGNLLRTHQLLCLLLLFHNFGGTLSSPSSLLSSARSQGCSQNEHLALLQFRNTFSIKITASSDCEYHSIQSYPKSESWKEDVDCCSWEGVTCDNVTNHVVGLDLSCSWLFGTISSNSSLFLLSSLQSLNLAFNDFNKSQISPKFGLFENLTYLNLSYSSFSGQVPSEVSYLSKLVSLDLSWSNLQTLENPVLEFQEPTLKGLVRNLTGLTELFLDGTNMSSIDPTSCFMNLSSSLTSLSLDSCSLHGEFPENIFHLPKLRLLSLEENQGLTGHFPKSNWSEPLEYLSLSWTSFSGELPYSIGELKYLKRLYLYACKFSGSLPTSLGRLSQLIHLDISENSFGGQIPTCLSNLSQIQSLLMSNNVLVGAIPESASLSNLFVLDLSFNFLNGSIPSWVYNLSSLEYLDLKCNRLTVIDRMNEFKHKSLTFLDLAHNKLEGPIPSSIFEFVNLTFLDLSTNNFSGRVRLDMFSKLQNLFWLDLSFNSLSLIPTVNAKYSLPNLHYLYLSSCNLSQFPDVISASEYLNTLDLSVNRINGQMSLAQNDFLSYLNLSQNLLTKLEQIPWKNIKILDLRSNLIQGNLPILPLNLNFFSISNNNLTGDIPSLICNLSSLEILDLSHNNLSGTIPRCMGNFSKKLSVLSLHRNNLQGTISPTFEKGCRLKNFNLNTNQLQGPLPPSLVNCRNIEVLDIGNNKFNDEFPHWLATLPQLQVLSLRTNQFQGIIRDSGANNHSFPTLQMLDLSNNNFTGPLPSEYLQNLEAMMNHSKEGKAQYMGQTIYYSTDLYDYSSNVVIKGFEIELSKILTISTSIDLSSNKFEGEIPEVIGQLSSLRGLNLSHNELTGCIPASLGNLSSLEWLDLSSNRLIGEIPSYFVALTLLSFLNLSRNQLVGLIPMGNQFNTFENTSYEGNRGLCGYPLSIGCDKNEKQQSPPLPVSEDEKETVFNLKALFLGCGFGFAVGVTIGFLLLQNQELEINHMSEVPGKIGELLKQAISSASSAV